MALEGKQFSHYRILQLIGKGGMGEVYLAEDSQVQRQVAAKVIRIEMVQPDQQIIVTDAQRLFWREATAIARLDHPRILPLYDHGETAIDGLHFAYLIMPYRPDGSLIAWLRKRAQTQQTQQLTLKQVVYVIQQASQALQYAHDRAVMHLDVKPANFLIRSQSEADEYPDLLLSDFGIARLASATSSSSQLMSGTPTYMAPEQCTGRPVAASDQYALAIMAYELLTGSPPFQGPPMSVMFAHVHEQPEPARKRNPLLPSAVDLVLQRALAKKPEERFPSIATFAQGFLEAFQGVPEQSTLRLLRPSLPIQPSSGTPSVHAPAANDAASPARNAQPFPPVRPVTPAQEKVTLPPTASADASGVPAPCSPIVPRPTVTPPPGSATLFPPPAPMQPNRRRAAALVGVLLLLIFVLVAGCSLGGATGSAGAPAQANGNVTATVQARSNATVGAQTNGSLAGKMWHVQVSGTSQWLQDVVWSGSQYVAVGGEQPGTILTSPDGHTWTAHSSGTSQGLLGIAWSGSQFVAVGGWGDTILTSPDGHTWTAQNFGPSNYQYLFSGVVWSGSQFVVVGVGGVVGSGLYPGTILTSPDGRTWTAHNVGTLPSLNGVVWSGSHLVVVGDSGTILTSP
jgi:serine/threonine protein kinase